MKKGAPAQNFYILLSGTAEVLDDSGTCLSRLSKKEGRFTFNPVLPEDQSDVPKLGSLMEILLEASKMIDEAGCDGGSSHGCHAGG